VYFVRNLFNINSPLIRFLGKAADLMILNILFLITCIPVITIGASLTALHYVTLRMVSGGEASVVRDYFHSFRQNFRQATAIWLILGILTLLLAYDYSAVWGGEGYVAAVVKVMSVVASAALVMIFLYVFAILAKFNNTVKGTLLNAVTISVSVFPRTLSMFMLVAACAALTFYTRYTFRWGLLFWVTLGFSSVTYFNSCLLKKTFDKLIGENDPTNGEIST